MGRGHDNGRGSVSDDVPTDDMIVRANIAVPEHVVYRSFETETVLLNLRTGHYHGLNPTGGRMLDMLRETGSVREVADAIAAETNHSADVVLRDLTRLCSDLAARGLIEVDAAQSG